MVRKIIPVIFILILGCMILPQSKIAAATFDYGDALQKSIYFYECQQSGELPVWNRARQWRANSCMNDFVTGGWYDGGDHVKFGLPMAYSASMLGWALYEYPDAFQNSGNKSLLESNLRFVLDYLVKCDQGTGLVYQIGNGNFDHRWWGSAEFVEKVMSLNQQSNPRPYYVCNASCVTAQTAAALAVGAKILGDSTYLNHAVSLFNLADSVRSDASYTAANGYYDSWSGFYDDLLWAAIWLYIATGDSSYLTKAEAYVPNLPKEAGSDTEILYRWGQTYDLCHFGALILLARATGKPEYHQIVQKNLDWWVNGAERFVDNGKLPYVNYYYNPLANISTEAFLAFIYSGLVADPALKIKYDNFGVAQINYILGNNTNNQSYMVGFGAKSPQHPFHRSSHGSWADNQSVPAYNRHILYGALVSGPYLDTDGNLIYNDQIQDFLCNNVGVTNNSGLVGALAVMYKKFGGSLRAALPRETPDTEFLVEAIMQVPPAKDPPSYTKITAFLNNRTSWPPRTMNDLYFYYFMDLSELFAKGYSESDVVVEKLGEDIPYTILPLSRWGSTGSIYYIKVAPMDPTQICPIGSFRFGVDEYRPRVQFKVTGPAGVWDPTNDPSNTGLTETIGAANQMPCYTGTTRLWGTEPIPNSYEVGTGLKGRYYETANGQLTTVFTRIDPNVNYDWGTGSPWAGKLDGDTFRVIWTGWIVAPSTGTYTFYTQSDDGIYLAINNYLLINNWTDHAPTENSGTYYLKAGVRYYIYLDYYENAGGALAKLLWSGPGFSKTVIESRYLIPMGYGARGDYYDNQDFTGYKLTRSDLSISFNWDTSSPDPSIGPDTFSVRWTGKVMAPYSGFYTFTTRSDDGVRLWVNNQLLIDKWVDQAQTDNNSTAIWLTAGKLYNFTMDYYENGGGASAALFWSCPSMSKQIIAESYLYQY